MGDPNGGLVHPPGVRNTQKGGNLTLLGGGLDPYLARSEAYGKAKNDGLAAWWVVGPMGPVGSAVPAVVYTVAGPVPTGAKYDR